MLSYQVLVKKQLLNPDLNGGKPGVLGQVLEIPRLDPLPGLRVPHADHNADSCHPVKLLTADTEAADLSCADWPWSGQHIPWRNVLQIANTEYSDLIQLYYYLLPSHQISIIIAKLSQDLVFSIKLKFKFR